MKYNVIFKDCFNRFRFVVSYTNKYGHYDIDSDSYKKYGNQNECYDFSKKERKELSDYFDEPYSTRLIFIPKWVGKILSAINKKLYK